MDPISPSVVPPSQIHSTFGCLFLAGTFSSVLWGIGCLQLFLYNEKYWKVDLSWLRAYVLSTWILDTAHQVLLLQYTYSVFVKGIVDPTLYIRFPKIVPDSGILASVVHAMVQLLFVRRAWLLSKKNFILTGVLVVAVMGQLATNLVYVGIIYNERNLLLLSNHLNVEIALNCVIAFTDTLLSVVVICLLRKSRSGFQRTDSIINRLVVYTVGSGFVTSIWMIIALIASSTARHSLIYALADLVLPKLYFNCMLASLNARSSLRGASLNQGESIHFRDISSNSGRIVNISADTSRKTTRPRLIECRVDIDIDSSETVQQKAVTVHAPSDDDPEETEPQAG